MAVIPKINKIHENLIFSKTCKIKLEGYQSG